MKPLLERIPKEVVNKMLRQRDCELEPDFLCFEDVYAAVAENVPKDFVVLDLGCYMAAQSYFFSEHKGYIGVDCYDMHIPDEDDIDAYHPPKRFPKPQNATYVTDEIRHFLNNLPSDIIPENTYVVMSYVPLKDEDEIWRKIAGIFPNCFLKYCGKEYAQGINAEKIRISRRKYQQAIYKTAISSEMAVFLMPFPLLT